MCVCNNNFFRTRFLFEEAIELNWLLPSLLLLSTLLWCHNGWDGVSNHQHHDCLLNRSFRRRSKKTSKLRVTGLCAGNSPVTGEFPAQMASNAENVSIWWRYHEKRRTKLAMSARPLPFPDHADSVFWWVKWQTDTLFINWILPWQEGHGVSNHRQLDCSTVYVG